ncbi:hypothetical protein AKJ16_DCAP00635, partial [Drosera capensis]
MSSFKVSHQTSAIIIISLNGELQPENLLNGIALNDPPPLTEYPLEEAESNDEDDVDERLLTTPIAPLLLISLDGVFMLLLDPSLLNEPTLFLSASGEVKMFFIRAHGGGGFSMAATFCFWLELLLEEMRLQDVVGEA